MINWDYDWFSELSRDKQNSSRKYFEKVQLETITKPTMLVDRNGKIFMWYLPGLLLPPRVVRSIAPVLNLLFLLTLQLE
jgi:hypothetical protein